MFRGLNFILQVAVNIDNFKTFGSDIFQTFYDVATSAEVCPVVSCCERVRNEALFVSDISLFLFGLLSKRGRNPCVGLHCCVQR